MKTIIILLASILTSVSMAAIAPDGNYVVDTDHASIGFKVSHLGISNVIGRFNTFSGSMVVVSGGESKVDFTIDAASVDTNVSRRDNHIRSEDFFDVDSFPTIKFSSTAVTYSAEGDPKTLTGDLNMHGVTKAVTFDVTPVGMGQFPQGTPRAGFEAVTQINRGDFGIDTFAGVVGEEITITVNVEIVKQ